jgi:hypothetical protein
VRERRRRARCFDFMDVVESLMLTRSRRERRAVLDVCNG